LSKKVTDIQLQQKRGGTPLFLPPELIHRKNYDEKIDVWGLGCVLYHIISVKLIHLQLQLPFKGDSIDQVSHEILTK
jgi:serine/threonine protein kinase